MFQTVFYHYNCCFTMLLSQTDICYTVPMSQHSLIICFYTLLLSQTAIIWCFTVFLSLNTIICCYTVLLSQTYCCYTVLLSQTAIICCYIVLLSQTDCCYTMLFLRLLLHSVIVTKKQLVHCASVSYRLQSSVAILCYCLKETAASLC